MPTRLAVTPYAVLVLLACQSLAVRPAPARAAEDRKNYAGRDLAEVIDDFAQRGLRIFYSSDLVRPWMSVAADPEADDDVAALAEILRPHELTVRQGLNETWLIVRQTRPPPTPEPRPIAGAIDLPAPVLRPPRPIEEIVVSASRYEIQGAQTLARTRLSGYDLEFAPDIGDDAIRSVARLPGMASNGVNALANVRGGEIGETLVRLDGLRLYDPFHLKDFQGVFSVIDPRVVNTMDIYTGGYPANFGDRMSGVIDVQTMPAPAARYHELSLSFFNSALLSAGQFADGRAEWLASIRRSNIDVMYDRFSDQPDGPRYTDAFARLRFDLNDRLTLTGSVLHASDDIVLADDADREEEAIATQTDEYAWLRLEHDLGGRTSGTTVLASTRIDSLRRGTSDKSGISAGELYDARRFSLQTLTSDWLRVIGARSLLEFGGGMTTMSGHYAYRDQVEFDVLFDAASAEPERSRNIELHPAGRQYYAYGSFRVDLTERLSTEYGLRVSGQDLSADGGPTVGPRLGVRYAITGRTGFRASWGRFFQSQGITEIQVSDGEQDFYRPQRSEHLVLGLDHELASGAMLRVEAYEKAIASLRPRYENLLNTRVLLPELKPDRIRIWPESARARGLEVSLERELAAFRWWGNLSLARVRDRIDGREVLRSWDQSFALGAGFEMNRKAWNLSAGLIYRSGWPTTPVWLDAVAELPTARAGERNSERMRSFGSLDVRISRAIRFESSELSVFLELANLTDRRNPCCFEYEIGDEEDAGLLVLDEQPYFPRIPSLGFTWSF